MGLDLAAAGFGRVQPKETGRPGYAPGDLLKLYIYGYLNRIRSSRRLEADAHRNVEVIWLPRRLKPDFKTLADFRRDNRNAFRAVFRQFVLLCRQLDLFGRELLAVDGTRIKAVNNKDRNFTRASLTEFIKLADARLDDYLQRLDTSDADEQAAGGSRVKNLAEKIAAIRQRRARCQAMLAELDRTGEDQNLAHRPGQPGHGGAHARCGRLQRPGRGGDAGRARALPASTSLAARLSPLLQGSRRLLNDLTGQLQQIGGRPQCSVHKINIESR